MQSIIQNSFPYSFSTKLSKPAGWGRQRDIMFNILSSTNVWTFQDILNCMYAPSFITKNSKIRSFEQSDILTVWHFYGFEIEFKQKSILECLKWKNKYNII